MSLSQSSVLKLYNTVIEDVIAGVRDAFLDEGVDEQVLQEMKQLWTSKLMNSKAVETTIETVESQAAPVTANSTPKTKANGTKSKSKSQAQREQREQREQQAAAAQAQQQQQQQQQQPTSNNAMNMKQQPNQQQPNAAANGPQKGVEDNSGRRFGKLLIATGGSPQMQPASQQPQPQQQQPPPPPPVVAGLDPNKIVPIQITLPAQPNVPNSEPRVLTIQVPASALQENQLHQALTATPIITSIMTLPPALASSVLQQHVNAVLQNNSANAIAIQKQMDGAADTSEEEGSEVSDDNLDNDDEDDVDKDEDEDIADMGAEEEPLNSDDDVSEEEQADLFDTDNVVVCQYDKITRSRNKWKFYLKDGIMNIGGKDYVFQKSNGDAEW